MTFVRICQAGFGFQFERDGLSCGGMIWARISATSFFKLLTLENYVRRG
jgi:hypothetical protein